MLEPRSKRVRALLPAAVLLTFCGSCAEAPSPEGEPASAASETPPWSIDRARVVLTARRGAVSDLYLLDRADASLTRLTGVGDVPPGANAPRVAPDGRRIVYQVRDAGTYDIRWIDVGGGAAHDVVRHPDWDVLPVWSPDGRRIAFMSTRGFELGGIGPFPGHIYLTAEDGTDVTQVTAEPLTSSFGPSDWSPDGTSLLLARVTDAQPDLFLLDLASGDETRLTDTPEGEASAVFSHDGDRIAFYAETADASQIVVMNRDGTGRRAVTDGPGLRYYPRWSPDDRWLLFTASDRGDPYDLRAVEIDTGRVIDLVATPEDEREGDWLHASPG